MKKKYDKITEDIIKRAHPNFCSFCNKRINFQLIQSKPFQGKIIQYLRCPYCKTAIPKQVLKIQKVFNYNPVINIRSDKNARLLHGNKRKAKK